jgi:uncharacterized protein (DUF1697 family)
MSRYVALLRGINVGGKNLIKMPALKACFEAGGLREVTTFIQSGNVIFDAAGATPAALAARIEAMLAATFGYPVTVVLRSRKQLQQVVERAPPGFGTQPARYRYDVVFLKEPLKAATVIKTVVTREGVDRAHAGTGVLYLSRLASRATQSRFNLIVALPTYKSMTLRNWNTTTKLLRLLDVPAT